MAGLLDGDGSMINGNFSIIQKRKNLSEEILFLARSLGFVILSLIFISTFTYYNYYKERLGQHWIEFIKRSVSTYFLSFLVVALLLTLIDKAPWTTDYLVALKRIVVVALPSSMSAAVADMIK